MCMLIKAFTFCRCIMQIHDAYISNSRVQRVKLICDRRHMHCVILNDKNVGAMNCHSRYHSNPWMGRTHNIDPDEFDPSKFDCSTM